MNHNEPYSDEYLKNILKIEKKKSIQSKSSTTEKSILDKIKK